MIHCSMVDAGTSQPIESLLRMLKKVFDKLNDTLYSVSQAKQVGCGEV